ncbi:MAG: efflux RND transporter permease subunit [Planctomycetota bacterium]
MSLAAFGVRKPVVANLVMFAIIGAGLIFGLGLRKEFFPEVSPSQVLITAPYPGAAPDEVEEALAVKIEDQIRDIDDVEEITSTVREGVAVVRIEFEEGVAIDAAVADVKREIDALQDLPDEADRIIVTKLEPNLPAISLSLYGDADERTMKSFLFAVRDDLESIPGMGDITISGVRIDEIRVEVRPGAMLRHGLSLPAISDRVAAAMAELPGGTVRGERSTLSIRAVGVDERAEEIRDLVVKASPGGQVVRLSDVATITDGFVDSDLKSRLNGEPAVSLTVFKVGDQDVVLIADLVKAYVKGRTGEDLELTTSERLRLTIAARGEDPRMLGSPEVSAISPRLAAWRLGHDRWLEAPPPGTLTTTTDLARFVVGRLDLLTRNALFGGLLVFATLVLLLNWRVSFWVAAGLVVSLLGTLAVMRATGVTLNLLTMFGLIVVIGILVDDAIVVAENIASRHERGEPALVAATRGTDQVAWPVVSTVLTTICAFLPLALIEGQIGDFLVWLPIVVACALSVSLIETLFILPVHMAHSLRSQDRARARGHDNVFTKVDRTMERAREGLFGNYIIPGYTRLLKVALEYRYISLAIALSIWMLSLGLIASGRVEFIFFETEDAETVDAQVQMPIGTPANVTDEVVRSLERAVLDIQSETGEIVSVFAQSGASSDINGEGNDANATHLGQLILELSPTETRTRNSETIIRDIRERVGPLPGIKSLRIEGVSGGPSGADLSYSVTADDPARLDEAVRRVEQLLAAFGDGVYDIATDIDRGQRELRFELLDGASQLGFTRASLGRQIQGMVFGLEAFTFAGNREDVDIRVTLPEDVRRNPLAITSQYVFTPAGEAVPLGEVARITETEGFATIRRLDGKRSVTVTAEVLRGPGVTPESIAAELAPQFAAIQGELPGVTVEARGRQQDVADSFRTLPIGMAVAAGLIYVVLAWLFGSFTQPLVVMSAIPFATVGMILGHLVLGYSLTMLSLIGFVALAGVVVNDSLIFMEFFNEERRKGAGVRDAAVTAGRARVRAILLTTVTTVLGLLPLMLETSFQAKFLIPMAITIACGLASATLVILVVLPSLLQIVDDIAWLRRALWSGDFNAPRKNPFLPDPELELIDKRNTD